MNIDEQGWLTGARRSPSPNYNQRPDPGDISLLVIHNISLPPGCFGVDHICAFFNNRLDTDADPFFAEIADLQVSAHLLIDRRGRVIQFVSFQDRAWHAGQSSFAGRVNCNDFAVGIELEGTDSIAYTGRQYQTLVRVSRLLMRHYPAITVDRIVGHSDIAPERKTDPGPSFRWEYFLQKLCS